MRFFIIYIYIYILAKIYALRRAQLFKLLYNKIWKKLRFILSVRSDFYMIDSLSIAIHAFVSHVSISFSVDETLLPR